MHKHKLRKHHTWNLFTFCPCMIVRCSQTGDIQIANFWNHTINERILNCMPWCNALATSGETLVKPNHRMRYLEHSTTTYSSIFSFYYDEIYMHQIKTSILYTNTNHIPAYLVCRLASVPIATRATRQEIRLIDNLNMWITSQISHGCQPMRKLEWEVWLQRVVECCVYIKSKYYFTINSL